jgi:hypothetical protein
MKLAKSLLLGSATAFVAVAGANAADLPSKKAAPATYVKVCDAYGAGFFNIPGTETCVKLGGRVRADYSYSQAQDVMTVTSGAVVLKTGAAEMNKFGSEVRGRVDLDARTPTAYGTVQAVASLRMARTTGVLDTSFKPLDPADGTTAVTINSSAAAATLEAAYVRFAGFTFGNAKDNFAFMPSIFYGAGHWPSFANGTNMIGYTAVLGGGVSATLALQDAAFTALKPLDANATGNPYFRYSGLPQINARLDWDQSWGTVSAKAATLRYDLVDTTLGSGLPLTAHSKQVWAAGAGVKINLPMIAAGDALWLEGNYADGMTEYTINWGNAKSSDTKRNIVGLGYNPASVIDFTNGIETIKSWNLAANFQHWFTPQHRTTFLATYGAYKAPTSSKILAWNGKEGIGDGTVWNVGAQYAFVPTKDFEIGIEALYARMKQDVYLTPAAATKSSRSDGAWTGRMRVERTF